MYKIVITNEFKRSVKRCKKRGMPMGELTKVMRLLGENGILPSQYKPRKLTGNHQNEWECHIKPDWLLIWKELDDELILVMLNTGSHADLF